MTKRELPVGGILLLIVVVTVVIYVAYTYIENSMIRFLLILIPLFIAISALMGLKQEYGIADKIVKEGYIDEYIKENGLGDRKTFEKFVEEMRIRGYTINPGTKAQLRKEIVERYEEAYK
jgi:cadmium resistance protein CadD (predicted permease)